MALDTVAKAARMADFNAVKELIDLGECAELQLIEVGVVYLTLLNNTIDFLQDIQLM
jgi:hypothetical protein